MSGGAGLKISIQSATLPASGSPAVTFQVTDAQNNPVDVLAEMAAGTFAPAFTLAERNPTTGVYTSKYEGDKVGASYKDAGGTSHGSALASAVQAQGGKSASASNVTKVSDGVYTYTFAAPPTSSTLTAVRTNASTQTNVQTVGIYGARTYEGTSYPAHAEYDFIPAGGAASLREVVKDDACNACHQNLTAHGRRRGVRLCLTCHSPQTTDPESGNTVDFRVMIHRLHSGQAGYQIVGFNQAVSDFSTVNFAGPTNRTKNCTMCHQGAQADNWNTVPSRAACGSCHTNVLVDAQGQWPGGGHAGGAQADDAGCTGCHSSQDIKDYHSLKAVQFGTRPSFPPPAGQQDPGYSTRALFDGKVLEIAITDVTNVATGQAPVISFTVKVNGQPYDITAAGQQLESLEFTVAGPTTDYSGTGKPSSVGYITMSPIQIADGTTTPPKVADVVCSIPAGATAAQCVYTAPAQSWVATGKTPTSYLLAGDASGTVAYGVAGAISETKADPGGTPRTNTYPIKSNAIVYRKVGGGTAVPRRSVIDSAKCNACHVDLGEHHASDRKNVDYCVFCHNPNNVNDERVARYELDPVTGATYKVVPNSVQLPVMIHKIHMGGDLSNDYVLGGYVTFGTNNPEGNPLAFRDGFPGDIGNCQTCHKAGTYGLPAATNLPTKVETWTCLENPTADTGTVCSGTNADTGPNWRVDPATPTVYTPPQTAACTSCHDSSTTVAHTSAMTVGGVESCSTCHGTGTPWDALTVHVKKP